MAIPWLERGAIAAKEFTGDTLPTQRTLAIHSVERQAHYHFTVKHNQLRRSELENKFIVLLYLNGLLNG